MTTVIFPYNLASAGAKELAQAMGCKRVKPDGKYVPKDGHTIINYGNSRVPAWWNGTGRLLNSFDSVALAVNKLHSFSALLDNGVQIPKFCTDRAKATEWFEKEVPFLARTALTGSGGEGIIVVDESYEELEIPAAPLYVQYIKKAREFRIHVVAGRAVFAQEKKRRSGLPNVNYKIRNLANGFVFCHNDLEEIPGDVYKQARDAVSVLGLDFGAVDVIWNNYHQKAYVLEVNTAPGLEGATVQAYASKLLEICDGK